MILTALLGFAAPIIPEVLRYFQRRQDNKHELELMKLRLEQDKNAHLYKMEELDVQADIRESEVIHQPTHSYGVAMLDASATSSMWGITRNLAFWLYVTLDVLNTLVRPTVTYWAFFTYYLAKSAVGWQWDQFDRELLILVLSYWFGQRAVKHAFKSGK